MLAVIDCLQNAGCQFFALVLQSGPLFAELSNRGIPTEIRGQNVSLQDSLRKFIDNSALNLIHANSLIMGRRIGPIAPHLPVPTTSHLRDIMNLSAAAISDLNQHQRLFAVSNATCEFHISQGVDPQRITTVYNGIDLNEFQPRPQSGWLKRELRIPDAGFVVAAIGQICLRKGQDDFAAAMTRLGQRDQSIHVILMGNRHSTKLETIEYDRNLDEVFESAGMQDRFHRLGFRDDIPLLLNEVDLVVHAARQEPLGRVLLEAAASEVPIVATRVGGTEEILIDNESALLVDSRAVDQIVTAVRRIRNDESVRNRLGESARKTVREKFEIKDNAHRLWNEWKTVIEAQRG